MDYIQTFCVLDSGNRFVCVGGDWDRFAEEQGSDESTGLQVAGKSIFHSVKGFETRSFLNAALFAVRDRQRQFTLDYRCDSPDVRRYMRMTVSPLRSDRLLMVHDFLHEEHIGSGGVTWLFAPGAKARKCSLCCSVEFGEIWLDPFETDLPHPHFVTYAMCPDCHEKVSGTLSGAQRGRVETKIIRFHGTPPGQARVATAGW
jgi:hypothetical protein